MLDMCRLHNIGQAHINPRICVPNGSGRGVNAHHPLDQKSVYMVLMPLCAASVKETPGGFLSVSYNTESEYLTYIRVGCYSPGRNFCLPSLNQYPSHAISECLYIPMWILGRRLPVCMQCSGMQFCPPLALISANKNSSGAFYALSQDMRLRGVQSHRFDCTTTWRPRGKLPRIGEIAYYQTETEEQIERGGDKIAKANG